MMGEIEYFTEAGLQKLKDELTRLTVEERPKIAAAIAEARDKGDLSENAEYDAAKEAQQHLEMKIVDLQLLISNARILDQSNMDPTKVHILSTVKIKNLKTKAAVVYEIVPEKEADLKQHKISVTSPIGKGLLGRSVGDKVDIQVPAGVVTFEIIELS
ncbi:MAG: transcription elongation factor GreA [Bacteroidales bacterium]|nr:transcription elongation factor GreA [Bacteroidales bacterium]